MRVVEEIITNEGKELRRVEGLCMPAVLCCYRAQLNLPAKRKTKGQLSQWKGNSTRFSHSAATLFLDILERKVLYLRISAVPKHELSSFYLVCLG
jgi:hypothetical protein